jgi:hypothetical protein
LSATAPVAHGATIDTAPPLVAAGSLAAASAKTSTSAAETTAAASSAKAAATSAGSAEPPGTALLAEAALLVKAAGAALLEVRISGTARAAEAGATAFVGIATHLLQIPAQCSIQKEGFVGSVALDIGCCRGVAG